MRKYDLLPSIEEIQVGEKITKSQLSTFWDILIVHYDLSPTKYNYENLELMTQYNASGSINYLNVILRCIGLCRLNYLAAQHGKSLSEKFLDPEQFKLVANHETWDVALREFNLSKKEYDFAMKAVEALKNRELPKAIVQDLFKNIVQLIVVLLRNVKKFEDSQNAVATIPSSAAIVSQVEKIETVSSNKAEQSAEPLKELAATEMEAVPQSEEKQEQRVEKEVAAPVQETALAETNNLDISNASSRFLRKIKILQKSSTETVVHANAFGSFQNYMHITRPIEEETIEKLELIKTYSKPQLMFICGSVGDGKSHLLAYLKQNREELLKGFYIHNDATESYNRTKSAEETLEQILAPFDDGGVPTQHIIVAINIGKLHNFYIRQEESGRFKALRQYIDSLKIFETNAETSPEDVSDCFHAVDFSKVKYYRINESGISSPFYLEAIQKITAQDSNNEIYIAWKEDLDNGIHTIVHDNYEMLMDSQVQKRVVEKLIQTIIRNKMIVSTRTFYNFIFDILVPSSVLMNPNRTGFAIQNTLPNLLFESIDRSDVLLSLNELDPLNAKGMLEDEIVTNVFIHADVFTYVKQLLNNEDKLIFEKVLKHAISKGSYKEIAKYVIRAKELLEDEPSDSIYSKFIQYIYSYYKGEYEALEELFTIIEEVFFKWKGSPRDNFIYVSNDAQKDYRLAVPVDLVPKVDEAVFGSVESEFIEASEYFLTIGFNEFLFELDLRLYEFLILVKNGYCPNLTEINQAIQFEEFYNKVVRDAEEKENRFLLVHLQSNAHFEVAKPKSKFTKNKYEVRKV